MGEMTFGPGDPRLFDDSHVFCYRNLGNKCVGCPTQQHCDDNHSAPSVDAPDEDIISRREFLIEMGYDSEIIALKSGFEIISMSAEMGYDETDQ